MAINQAIGIQQEAVENALSNLQQAESRARADLQPYREAGNIGLSGMTDMRNAMSRFNPNITMDYEQIKADPLYGFARDEGLRAVKQQLAKQGILDSSAGNRLLAKVGCLQLCSEL